MIGPSSEAVALTRAEARRRLVLDAPEAGRALLRRLACIQGKFDRPLAVGAASVDPSIQESTASLDLLIGPWIEAAPGSKKYLRLSPLLAGLNEDVPLEEATDTRLRVAYDVATRGPMDLEDLGIAFWNSVSAKSGWMLARLQLAFLSLSEDGFKAVAQELSALSYFRTDRPIFPDDSATSVTLRIIQLEVAAATDNSEVFRASTIAALQESSRFEDEELRSAFEVMVLMKALFARGVHVEWQLRLAWIAQFEELVARFPHLADEGSSPTLRQMRQEQGPDATISGFFVTIGGQTIQSVSDLEDLFNALQELEPALRTRRLRELRAFHRGYGLYVQQGWASAWFAGTLAADAALTTYERLADVALAWGDAELAAECLVAQTILMEEHLNRAEEALLRIDAALGQTPDGVILLRQKAKLLGHMNRYSEAAVILDALKAEIDKQSPIERMYALKEAAVAAGNTGSLRKAADLFEAAAAAVDGDLDAKLACHRIALRTEAALCCWKLGEHREALERYSRVLDLLPDIDPENSDTAKMLHLRVRFGAGWIEADVSRPFKTPPVLKIGATAALDVDMTKIDRAISGPLEDIKLLLRAVALRLGLGDLFTSLELPRTTPDYHFVLRGAELDYAMIGMDGKTIAAAAVALLASIADLRGIHADNLPIGDDAATGTPKAIRILMAGIAMRVHVLGGLSNAWWDGFVDDCRGQFGLLEIDLSDLKTADGTEGPSGDAAWNVMQGLFACRETKTPSERFEFHLNCVQAAMASAPAQSVINALIAIIRDDWAWSFGRQRFLLRQAEVGLAQFEETTRLVDQRAPGGLMALMQMAAFVLRTEFQPSWVAAFERVGGKRAA